LRFVETPIFTKEVRRLLPDEAYRELQWALEFRPTQGVVIRGSGGLRKLRWGAAGRGKRGGIRLIYYWDAAEAAFYMLYAYAKGVRDDLTPEQLKLLRQAVREEFR
jgi:mRNA-degrading endonuclease RelE of RelBE toxin-antitoxin system